METKEIKTKQYILTEEEMKTVRKMAKYCRHRITEHRASGINNCTSNEDNTFINYLANR